MNSIIKKISNYLNDLIDRPLGVNNCRTEFISILKQ